MSRPPQPGDLIADRYELEELVGSGGMSAVFRAHDRQLERRVAIKILRERFADDGEYVERFRREARAVARLSHPNIVTVIDRGEDGGRQFIVFEYVDGENLKDLVVRSGRLPLRRAVELALAVADGLAFAHGHGLVHRDVKPQNVLLGGEGDVKVTDFGIARSLDVDRGMTQTGTVLGTGHYLAPEQASGTPVSPATDVYSLGVVLWELLTGETPFTGDNMVAVALLHVYEPLPSLRDERPDVPPRLAAAIERALEKDPERRFPAMDAFAAELRACLAELEAGQTLITAPAPAAAGRPARAARPRKARRLPRRLLAYAAIALAVAAAAFAAVFLLAGSHHTKGGSGGGGGGGGSGTPVQLTAVGEYNPSSRKDSHADTAAAATDGNASTTWYTQIYRSASFGGLIDGLGLVLDAGSSVKLASLTVHTPNPGFTAQILSGDSPGSGFAADSAKQTVSDVTTFTLSGRSARYYVVWITLLPPGGKAEISEVTGTS